MTTDLALPRRLSDYLDEYQEKAAALPAALEAFERAGRDLQMAATIGGTYGQGRIDVGRNSIEELYRNLGRSAWISLKQAAQLVYYMPVKSVKRLDQYIETAPEFTVENIERELGEYISDKYGSILRGLAEVFCDLDPAYKSHERVKIGADKLPKRIILSGFEQFSHRGWEQLANVVNAIAAYRGEMLVRDFELRQGFEAKGKEFLSERGMEIRAYKNGNAHLHFSRDTLADVNLALAEYYGDVLADAYTDRPDRPAASTAVATELQYYPTPEPVVEWLLDDIYMQDDESILEPSCGCGRIIAGILGRRPNATVHGVEVCRERAEKCWDRGFTAAVRNFLDMEPGSIQYDRVIMNPPFYGRHYAKHVAHAMRFLRPGGSLHAILPVTARTDHGLIDAMGYVHSWRDLPVGSFRESGTNINTTILTMRKPE